MAASGQLETGTTNMVVDVDNDGKTWVVGGPFAFETCRLFEGTRPQGNVMMVFPFASRSTKLASG